MVLLENESFLTELTRLFQKSRNSGSVYITMKRYDGRTKPKPRPSKLAANPLPPVSEYKCLIRAHLGNKKLSTIVNAKDVNKFQLAYANLLKGNMDGLKKKDKKKVGTSTKATQ
ncbi:signal recognition particle 14 kDa protein [Caerostris darwini]|uniref:Signal recognition particle 14 kDa protein n=2 Tax=Caerostris TaxID=172845 RepID=A0AAV4SS85_9ARAC|nr:signal recognition particle 14 kDa protein [Caerostris darwini]GIY52474.1 signal recognition particle 14 kDa protein [Caerostris extrusa]